MNHKEPTDVRMKKPNIGEIECVKYFKRNKIAFGRFGYDNENLEYEKEEFTEDDELLRKRPDYIIYGKGFNFCFVEVKIGAADGVKIKDIDVKGYKYWNKTFPVWIYVYYAKAEKHELIKLNDIISICKEKIKDVKPEDRDKMWNNGYPYTKVLLEEIQSVIYHEHRKNKPCEMCEKNDAMKRDDDIYVCDVCNYKYPVK